MTDILAELKRLNAERTQGEFPWHYDIGFKDLNANGRFIAAMSNHATALIEIAEAAQEVYRISERNHDAWNKLRAALAALEPK